MARKKRSKKTYQYPCTITGAEYTVHTQAKNPEDLVSVSAYYQLHPEKDDRPEKIKLVHQLEEEAQAESSTIEEDQ